MSRTGLIRPESPRGIVACQDLANHIRTFACTGATIPIDLKKDAFMAHDHDERRESGFYVTGSRVPMDRIIREYSNGEDPETIRSHYPTL